MTNDDDEQIKQTFLELIAGVSSDTVGTLHQLNAQLLQLIINQKIELDGLREEVTTLFKNLTSDLLQLQQDIAALIDITSSTGSNYHKLRIDLEDHFRKCALYTLEQQTQAYIDETQGR